MAKRPPSHLKLHTQDWETPPQAAHCPPEVAEVCRSFSAVTGWPLRFVPYPESPEDIDLLWSAPVNPGVGASPGHMRIDLGGIGPGVQTMPLEQAQELAESLVALVAQYFRMEEAVRHREAELATGVPVISRDRSGRHLADTLGALLKAAAGSVGGEAAALYLLDDATTELKLRASYNLPADELLQPARPLQGSIADLEALLGHAVTLEASSLFDYWKVPRPCGSAVCVPVATSTIPLGTLWVFCNSTDNFDNEEINLVEIIAGRIAADLEREVLLGESLETKDLKNQLQAAQDLQQSQLPRIAPLVDGWDVAGWTGQGSKIGGSFHDWFVLADNSIALAAGDALEGGLDAGLCVSGLRTALRAHAEYPHSPEGLLNRVNSTLWTSSAGDQFASLFYAIINQRTGEVRYSSAGRPMAWVLGQSEPEPLVHATWPLGVQPEPNYSAYETQISPGSLLLICSGLGGRSKSSASSSTKLLLPSFDGLSQCSAAEDWLDHIRGTLCTPGGKQDRSILVIKRL